MVFSNSGVNATIIMFVFVLYCSILYSIIFLCIVIYRFVKAFMSGLFRSSCSPDRFYIGCDVCQGWFHGECMGISVHDAVDMTSFSCPSCR